MCLCCDLEVVNSENDASRFAFILITLNLFFHTNLCFCYKNKTKHLHSDSTAKLKTEQEIEEVLIISLKYASESHKAYCAQSL